MKTITILFLAVAFCSLRAQQPVRTEIDFVEHLVNLGDYEDALAVVRQNLIKSNSPGFSDSMNYLAGWCNYSLKNLQESTDMFMKVTEASPYYFKSRYFSGYNQAHLGKTDEAFSIFKSLDPDDPKLIDLKNFELAGNSLLSRDMERFMLYYGQIEQSQNFRIAAEKEKFREYASGITGHHPKSVFLGGLFSALVPGSGKIYAGKTGEGIGSLIIVSAMGLTAYENYRKEGFGNAKTLIFGSLFSILYIGNIYGTLFTVKMTNEEFDHEMDNRILFNMHIPLRNFFN